MPHPLHSQRMIDMIACREVSADRRTGRSTVIALRTIAEAIENPEKKIKIIDHYSTYDSNKILAHTICDMIQVMQLKCLVVDMSNLTLTLTKND